MEYYSPRQFVECLLPDHYTVKESLTGRITCQSSIGIEDEQEWDKVFATIKQHFSYSFKEVHHWTCYCHKRFTIYYNLSKYIPKSQQHGN
jgi:hypothetical protein